MFALTCTVLSFHHALIKRKKVKMLQTEVRYMQVRWDLLYKCKALTIVLVRYQSGSTLELKTLTQEHPR